LILLRKILGECLIHIEAAMEYVSQVTMTHEPHIVKTGHADEVHIPSSALQGRENQQWGICHLLPDSRREEWVTKYYS
jgi:hypothetical protein